MWTFTCSGRKPAIFAAAAWSPVWNCVPVQISQAPGRTSAVAFNGSIVACAR